MDDTQTEDICRVCRCEGTVDKPLFHPCICTGSIKFIHQDCLVQWLKYSKKEYCELCKHRFNFTPIYSPDMPKRLPIKDILSGLARSMGTAIKCWLHYTLVALAWLAVVPITACRIYRTLFSGSISSLFTLPLDLISSENIPGDILQGLLVVGCTLSAFFCLVWLREQIIFGGGPDWLERDGNNEEGDDTVQNQEGNPENAEEPLHEQPAAALVVANNNNGDVGDDNWNPIEWDRAEDLTWERLLGLDGSLAFLEHVFWVVSLNTMCILVFAFCPYNIGHYALMAMKARKSLEANQFEGIITTVFGYFIVGCSFVILHAVAGKINFAKAKKLLGVCYVIVKVFLLTITVFGILPIIGGWWLDICSLTLFDSTLKDRIASLNSSPATFMLIHWFVGMIFSFYFITVTFLLREFVRPGTLWFLRNINDPDFNPIQELIHLPLTKLANWFIVTIVTFGSIVLLIAYFPIKIISYMFPKFLPYYITLSSESPISEITMEFFLLQFILPALVEQGHTRNWLKEIIKCWCIGVSCALGVRSYLLGDVPLNSDEGEIISGERNEEDDNEQLEVAVLPAPEPVVNDDLEAPNQAVIDRPMQSDFQPYIRPKWFTLRLLGLIFIFCISLILASAALLTVPVFVGRNVLALITSTSIHELYTLGAGLYFCMFIIRFFIITFSWFNMGWNQLASKTKYLLTMAGKAALVLSVVVGLIPLLLGILGELVIHAPIRVPLYQTPVYQWWSTWALGFIYLKIICASIMVAPAWWLKTQMEDIYMNGLRNINMDLVLSRTALPVANFISLSIALPYIISESIIPIFVSNDFAMNLQRRIYPVLACVLVIGFLIKLQLSHCKRMYEHIRNDKYLVGKRLVNYNHRAEEPIGVQ